MAKGKLSGIRGCKRPMRAGRGRSLYARRGLLSGLISATATENLGGGNYGSTSEFSLTSSAIYTLSGAVFEDKGSDLLVSGQVIGDSNNPGLRAPTVRLYADGGDGVADGAMTC